MLARAAVLSLHRATCCHRSVAALAALPIEQALREQHTAVAAALSEPARQPQPQQQWASPAASGSLWQQEAFKPRFKGLLVVSDLTLRSQPSNCLSHYLPPSEGRRPPSRRSDTAPDLLTHGSPMLDRSCRMRRAPCCPPRSQQQRYTLRVVGACGAARLRLLAIAHRGSAAGQTATGGCVPRRVLLLQVYLRYARKYGCDLSEQEVLRRFRWGAAMSYRPGIKRWWLAGDGPACAHWPAWTICLLE